MGFDNVNVNVSGPVQPTSTYKTKVLKGNHSFASQVTESNMKYVIKYDFDLGGETVTIPANCILEFDGGSISNGTIINLSDIANSGGIVFKNIKLLNISCDLKISYFDTNEIEDIVENVSPSKRIKFIIDKDVTITKRINIVARLFEVIGESTTVICDNCDGFYFTDARHVVSGKTLISNIKIFANVSGTDVEDLSYTGILIHGATSEESINNCSISNVYIRRFEKGIELGSNVWCIILNNCSIAYNTKGITHYQSFSNAGERITITNSVIWNNKYGIFAYNSYAFFITNTSFDYNTSAAISMNNAGTYHLTNCHIEYNSGYIALGQGILSIFNSLVIYSGEDVRSLFQMYNQGRLILNSCQTNIRTAKVQYINYNFNSSAQCYIMIDNVAWLNTLPELISNDYLNAFIPIGKNMLYNAIKDANNYCLIWNGNDSGNMQFAGNGSFSFYIPCSNKGYAYIKITSNNANTNDKFVTFDTGILASDGRTFTAVRTGTEIALSDTQNGYITKALDLNKANTIKVTLRSSGDTIKTFKFEFQLTNYLPSINSKILQTLDSINNGTPNGFYIYGDRRIIQVISRNVAVDSDGNYYSKLGSNLPSDDYINEFAMFHIQNASANLGLIKLQSDWKIINPMPKYDQNNVVKFWGSTINRPDGSVIYTGFRYFDTTLGKPIYCKNIANDNTVTWVDATGNNPDVTPEESENSNE